MDKYERSYEADMMAQSRIECCEAAGVELIQEGHYWRWRFGMRSSADQYCEIFDTKEEAASHFVTTREFRDWLRRNGVFI